MSYNRKAPTTNKNLNTNLIIIKSKNPDSITHSIQRSLVISTSNNLCTLF